MSSVSDEDADKTTIQLKSGTSATVLKTHQDISGKADKVSGATSGHFAGLNGNGNLTDSVKSASDFGTADEIADIVNFYGAKNLIPYPYSLDTFTQRDVTFTVNSDGSVDFSGTPNNINSSYFTIIKPYLLPKGSYILSDGGQADYGGTYLRFYDDEALTTDYSGQYSGLATVSSQIVLNTTSNGGYIQDANCTHKYGYEKKFTIYSDAYVEIQLRSGSSVYPGEYVEGTVYPMLRLASIQDDTYVPYVPTNKTLHEEKVSWEANGILGAKNLIPYPYHRASGYSSNGATATYDEEGVITVNKVAGSATAYFALFSSILFPDVKLFLAPNTEYILSMELEDAVNTSCFIQATNGVDLAAIRNKGTGKYEVAFTTPKNLNFTALSLYWGSDVVETNAKVKVMLRLASDPDDTYQPYAMTNGELTDGFIPKPLTIDQTTGNNPDDVISNAYYVKCGKLCHMALSVKLNSEVDFSTYDSGYVVGKIPMNPKFLQAGSAYVSGHAQVLGAVVEPSSRQDVCLKGDITVAANATIRINVTFLTA